jgi:hypothetical protein
MSYPAGLTRFQGLPLAVRLLLVTEMMFNIGFYLVVPFLATYMSHSLAATGAMIGLVLGLRTFSQQGLFFVGGALTDRFGVKPILLIGIAIRVVGFIGAGLSDTTTKLMISVVLIGVAAALFSPAAEAAFAVAGRKAEDKGLISRSELFALDTFFLRIGALIGPVLGALLLPTSFAVMCFVAAGIFALLFVSHALIIPAVASPSQQPVLHSIKAVLKNRLFLAFALVYSTGLVTYNQQYLALPVELDRALGSQDALGWMFVFASVLTLALQLPLTNWATHRPAVWSLGLGFGCMALSFAIIAVLAPGAPLPGYWAVIPILVMLFFLHVGQMIAIPIARDLVGIIANEQNVGTYFGFLNSFGGLAVLLSSLLIGRMLDYAATPQPLAALPWASLTIMLVISTAVLPKIATIALRRKEPSPATIPLTT